MKNHFLVLPLLFLIFSCSESVDSKNPLVDFNSSPNEWLLHGRTYAEERHSPLDQINTSNVDQIGLSWSFETGTNRGHETTPIVKDGVMFITAPWSVVHALDAKTGDLLWTHDPQVERAWANNACCDVVNRGVALYENSIFFGTLDGRLISLDKDTGTENWSILTIDKSRPYTITGAPRIVKGNVIIGNGGGEFGVRGYVTAYDVDSGDELWRFYTVPGNPNEPFESPEMEIAAKTWSGGKWWEYGGGGTVWDSMAYDPALDTLYIGTGNGSPWNRYVRSPGGGDNLYLSSIVALDPDTGDYKWHYQTTPGDSWDYTATQHMILADLEINGQMRKVIMQAPKNGFFYVIDRTNGELISAENYVPINWATHVDMETGRPVENPANNYFDTPALTTPGPLGGHNWQPMAFNPDTGLVYIPAQEMLFVYSHDKDFEYNPKTWNTGQQIEMTYLPKNPDELAMVDKATFGYLLAWDPVAQKEVWREQYQRPWSGGLLSTAGDLVLQGTSDGRFIAFDAASGEILWSVDTGQGIIAPPITYMIDEEQYIAVQVGYGGAYALAGAFPSANKNPAQNGRMLVFKLGGEEMSPPVQSIAKVNPVVPSMTTDALTIARGEYEYHEHCQFCHGAGVIGGGVIPDLRYLDEVGHKTFLGVILGGMHSEKGMASFKDVLSLEQANQIQAYIISQAKLTGVSQEAAED
ncbi:MAG: alcohol dehydrogenase [Gammaproteobacteria bacterium]|nr:MAG: alcohol dehydrogenase [Gammaproteobacteria bacterium]